MLRFHSGTSKHSDRVLYNVGLFHSRQLSASHLSGCNVLSDMCVCEYVLYSGNTYRLWVEWG